MLEPAARRRPGPKPRAMLANVPPFADMAELDAWIESCRLPCVDRSPGFYSEAEWQEGRVEGCNVGSGNWPR